ncbi:uncharacterized protein BcabD6B2_33140 [Babesia caballi]|uniref:Uncharacterized protein n=1 Tax=Babesia caballi TaxID=5871 RepID=A0AAV4LV04_BABCB|nr:hypothetical protein BcabD6B2_33140 [Babesia caballi]
MPEPGGMMRVFSKVCAPHLRKRKRSELRLISVSWFRFSASESRLKSTWTEWSMTRSTGTRGLMDLGSLPAEATYSRMAARSTMVGTPLRTCGTTLGDLREILEQHARRHEGDFSLLGRRFAPAEDALDVAARGGVVVAVPHCGLQQHADGVGQLQQARVVELAERKVLLRGFSQPLAQRFEGREKPKHSERSLALTAEYILWFAARVARDRRRLCLARPHLRQRGGERDEGLGLAVNAAKRWSRLVLELLLLATTQQAGPAGSDETDLLPRRSATRNSARLANVLVVTTTVRVVHGVHGNTTHARPAVALGLVLEVGSTGLEERLVNTTAAGDEADNGTRSGLHTLTSAGRKTDPRHLAVVRVPDDGGVGAGSFGQTATVAALLLETRNDGTLRHLADGQAVANRKAGFAAKVDVLAGVHALDGDHALVVGAELVGIAEVDVDERSPTTRVVDNLLHDTTDVAVVLRIVEPAKLGGALAEVDVGLEHRATTLTLTCRGVSNIFSKMHNRYKNAVNTAIITVVDKTDGEGAQRDGAEIPNDRAARQLSEQTQKLTPNNATHFESGETRGSGSSG